MELQQVCQQHQWRMEGDAMIRLADEHIIPRHSPSEGEWRAHPHLPPFSIDAVDRLADPIFNHATAA